MAMRGQGQSMFCVFFFYNYVSSKSLIFYTEQGIQSLCVRSMIERVLYPTTSGMEAL